MGKRHALIITAYQELDYLEELCEIYSLYFNCYVHIDKKNQNAAHAVSRLNKIKNVFAVSLYSIHWGSYRHILAILYLLQKALLDGMNFFHIISANTILIKNPKKVFSFFENNPQKIYMEVKENKGQSFYEFEYRYTAYFFQYGDWESEQPPKEPEYTDVVARIKSLPWDRSLHILQNT